MGSKTSTLSQSASTPFTDISIQDLDYYGYGGRMGYRSIKKAEAITSQLQRHENVMQRLNKATEADRLYLTWQRADFLTFRCDMAEFETNESKAEVKAKLHRALVNYEKHTNLPVVIIVHQTPAETQAEVTTAEGEAANKKITNIVAAINANAKSIPTADAAPVFDQDGNEITLESISSCLGLSSLVRPHHLLIHPGLRTTYLEFYDSYRSIPQDQVGRKAIQWVREYHEKKIKEKLGEEPVVKETPKPTATPTPTTTTTKKTAKVAEVTKPSLKGKETGNGLNAPLLLEAVKSESRWRKAWKSVVATVA